MCGACVAGNNFVMIELRYTSRARRDIEALDPAAAGEIRRAIETKLAIAPEAFGKPLRYSLKFLRVLRAGDWRIVFQLSGGEVLVLTIRNRKDGYRNLR